MPHLRLAVALALALLLAQHCNAAELVTDGGFELGPGTPFYNAWSPALPGSQCPAIVASPVHSGSFAAQWSTGCSSGISQNLNYPTGFFTASYVGGATASS